MQLSTLLVVLALGQAPTDDNWERLRDEIVPTREELRWRAIAWRPSVWEGVLDAQKEDKPVLLWAMNGHPLACT